MKAGDVVNIIKLLCSHHIEVYVDGGWCVDALVGTQTREHLDLDIAVPHKFDNELRTVLKEKGFEEFDMSDSWACNYVLRNQDGLLIDVHTYELDDSGGNIFGIPYERTHFTGTGSINGYPVKCVSAEWAMKFHTGYALDEND
jgi:lincosamide nucleotidyltransferase A/C/D/E